MAKSVKNGPVNHGIPYGSMVPPKSLSTAFNTLASAESKIMVTREDIKKSTATFYKQFKAKYPKSGLADFARQFSKAVPFKREAYRVDATYMAIANMFRYMPEIKGKAVAKRTAKPTSTRANKVKVAVERQGMAERCLMSIVQQIGIPVPLLRIAMQRAGYTGEAIEGLLNKKGTFKDVGLGTYQLAVKSGKNAGLSASQALAQANVKQSREIASVPTAAELASAAKGKPVVTVVQHGPAILPEKIYKGNGAYVRVVKHADNLSVTK